MAKDNIQMGTDGGRFQTTRWSLISEIKDPDSTRSRDILNSLFQDYWKPVYCYIRNRGIDSEKANDLTQDYFCNILFEKNLFRKAQKSRGKFRSLILTSLKNFLISENRYQTAQKRAFGKEILNVRYLDTIERFKPAKPFEDEDGFNYAWIVSLLDNVSEKVKKQYCSKGKESYWIAFDRRFMNPTLRNIPAPSLSEICNELGIEDEVKASNMVTTVKRRFRKALRTHIREYVYSDQDVDEELSELIDFLLKNLQDAK